MAISVIFFGTPAFAIPSLRALAADERFAVSGVITQPDKPSGRGKKITPSPVKVVAKELGFEEHLGQADVFAVVAYGKILSDKILRTPKYGVINVHPSLLPKYRGPSPIQTALLDGEAETGVCIILLEPGPVDAGPLLMQKTVPIPPFATYGELSEQLGMEASKMLPDAIFGLVEGSLTPRKQNHSLATQTRLLSKKDGCIDWADSALLIERRVRAFSPWPGAFTTYQGKRILIHRAHQDEVAQKDQPGTFIQKDSALSVACGSGVLIIDELQVEGKQRQAGFAFIQGYARSLHGASFG